MSNKTKLSTIMREKRIRNAPALLAAAELGMAWEEEAKAARPFISMERIKVWSDAEGLPGLAQHNRYMAARAHTDQLTGRIGQ